MGKLKIKKIGGSMKFKGILVSVGILSVATFFACKARTSDVANAKDKDAAYYERLAQCGENGACRDRVLLDAILGNKDGILDGNNGAPQGGTPDEPVEFATVTYYGQANCGGDNVSGNFNNGTVDEFCEKLGKKYKRKDKVVFSIKINNGQCQNILQQKFSDACEANAQTQN
jgi:hypothetical protein